VQAQIEEALASDNGAFTPTGVRKFGVVKWFNGEKGYGFVTTGDKVAYFVHYSFIIGTAYRTLDEGQNSDLQRRPWGEGHDCAGCNTVQCYEVAISLPI
jgi:cold shock protein